MAALALVWDLIAKDSASPAFLRTAAAADKAAEATARSTAALSRSSLAAERAAAGMSAAGAKMTKGVTLPLLGIAAVSVKMAGDFQQSTNVLVTAAGESVKNLGLIRKGILEIATTTGTSWKSITDGMYLLEKAGYRGADALKIEKAAAQGAREEGANLATVSQALTSVMASYHLKASDAVRVTNEMKTAAGESKTTMEQFAGSLSTVLPLASANKISFADIAGSLASLTQHGTTADEAAQELAFTMRGLSAPNQVAIKEMAQLGISSVDVSKKLGDGPGGRGLAGTLNYLSETVLRKMGKSGTVLLSTFNASKVAAHDAQIEYDHLGTAAKKLADGYIKGTITQKDWTAGLKGLTPMQATLAKQFATTENNAKGFQQAIKNGVSGSQTYSDALKKMTGGANGLNTVLQLTGESMDGTNERIKRVQDSANGAGKDVSGWASTQKLFNVQLDIFKQKLAATAIQLGTQLLPVFQKIIGVVSGVVTAFSGLSSTQKQIFAWSAGILFAIGPVLSIGSKLIGLGATVSRATVGIASSLTAMAGTSFTTSARINTAVGGMTAALGGAGIGVMVGSLTRNSSTTVKALGLMGSAAAGAAIGFGAGGPLGAALGGLGGLIGAAVGSLGLFGKSAHAQIKPTDDLTNAIRADGDAFGYQTSMIVASTLEHKGAYDAAGKLGVSQRELQKAAMGNASAQALVSQRVNEWIAVGNDAADSGHKLSASQQAAYNAAKLLANVLPDVSDTLAVNAQAARNVSAALYKIPSDKKINIALHDGASAVLKYIKAAIDALHDKSITITQYERIVGITGPNGTANQRSDTGRTRGSAHGSASWTVDGKLPRNSVSTVGERGWEAAITDSAGRTQIFSHADSKRMFAASGLAVPGYAGGTGKPDVYTVDGSTTHYTTRMGAMNAARREYKAQVTLGVKINTKDLTNLNKIIHGTVDQARAWFTKLSDHLKGLPGFASYMVTSGSARGGNLKQQPLSAWLKDEDKKLNSAIGSANATAGKLKAVRDKMAQLRDGVKSAVTGFFDVTQAGANPVTGRISGAGMLAQQRQALLQIKKFNADLHRLESRHLNKAYLMELASQGPSVVPQLDALLAMSPRQFSAFNRNEALINRYGASAGRGVSSTVYGAQEKSLEKLEHAQRQAARDIIKEIRHELVPAVKKLEHQPINVYLDGKKIAEATRKSDKQTARR